MPLAALAALGACASPPLGPAAPDAAGGIAATGPSGEASDDTLITHIHRAIRERDTILVATHQGLFRLAGHGQLVAVSPPIDLMGFAIATDGTYVASGHPAPQSDLPQPVGLIQSADRGRTWSLRSRGGQSDFHALTALGPGVMAFDDALRFSPDRVTWQDRRIPAPPRDLAAGPDGTVLATTERGLLASDDRGLTWRTVTTPQLMLTVTWAGPRTIVGASTTGVLMVSRDAGATWTTGPRSVGEVSAVTATLPGADQIEILLVVGTQVLRTNDLGAQTQILV
ncbi:F510_1955 family glycosylhydrolase [Terrabacter sp. NPDC000476]|uniref:F510_1955 family glycosylhydrolase n=1 Tax=Terrabacter sp. NPDC000476 TaxID=3154258 RepID=UPI00331E8A1E